MSGQFTTPASEESLLKTINAVETNGIEVFVFEGGDEAKKKLFEMIPGNAEVMNMTSTTLDTLGVSDEIINSGRYSSVRKKLMAMDQKTQWSAMRKLGSAADYTVGSVHAVTENGEILIASASGSQLAAYAYGTGKVIWVAGTQKIVKDLKEGTQRIYEHCLRLEDERARKVYGIPSSVNKILTIIKDTPGRITILFVKQNLGF